MTTPTEFFRPPTILIVDDDDSIRFLLIQELETRGFKAFGASSGNEALQLIARFQFDIILLDQYLKSELGTDLLAQIYLKTPHSKVVFFTSQESVKFAIKIMSQGANGYLLKSDKLSENIEHLIQLAVECQERKVKETANVSEVIGKSLSLKNALQKALKVKNSESTVLLTGESGVGKEKFAKFIHNNSNRSESPFIAINCAAISENLLEAELFGYKKGAFTDAKADRKGFFETCSNGTLLLDEIGETSLSLQAKLLRVLQEKEVTPVGSRHPIKVNTRILAATNRNLLEAVSEKKFREDLYYRLAVINIEIPPLRDRKEDIPLLLESFISALNKQLKKSIRTPPNQTIARLKAYNWPGNVRELYNALERGILLADGNELHIDDLLPARHLKHENDQNKLNTSNLPLDYTKAKDLFEKSYVENLLKSTNYNVSDAAKLSNQYRTNIYRLIKKHHIRLDRHPPQDSDFV